MNLCPLLMFLMLVGYHAFLCGSVVSVDREGNESAKAFFAVLNPSLVMEFVFEIRSDNTVPVYSGTPMRCMSLSQTGLR
jgi:steroid 5-alpha reductase family enzyme